MRVCLGGTFDFLHRGHRDLLTRACEIADELLIGLTTDEFANSRRDRRVTPYLQRRKALAIFLEDYFPHLKVKIRPLEEEYGPALEGDYQAIVVSEGTRQTTEALNAARRAAGRKPLKVVVVPHRLAADGLPISSSRIAEGRLDKKGRLLGSLRVAVGSSNPVKLGAVKAVCDGLFEQVAYHNRAVASGVPEQPRGVEQTALGALNRAKAVLQGEVDFGVGIEAGLIESPLEGEWLDVQYCVVVDRSGRVTLGHGAGFAYPPPVLEGVANGETVGEAMARISGVPDIGQRQGAVGYLSKGKLARRELTQQAVLAAFIPRVRQELYQTLRPLAPRVEAKARKPKGRKRAKRGR